MKDVNILKNNGIDVDASMQIFGDMSLYDETAQDFLDAVDDRLAKLKQYKEAGDMPNYAIEAHALKSDSKYLGFTQLAQMALDHELKGKANDINFVYANYDALINEINHIVKVVREYLGVPVGTQPVIKTVPVTKNDQAILVVDDSNIIQNFVKKIFSSSYDVIVATDGKQAIDAVALHPEIKIACMLLDLNMPNVNGFEVLDYMSKNSLFIKVPVSIITGEDSKDNVQRAFAYPIIDVLSKPFNENDVKRVVERTIMANKM